jgi:hypothetical protein
MAAVPSYFKDFLSNIRLTQNQVDDLITGHRTLRNRLESDDVLSDIIISTFLQGSYRRSTAVRPKNDSRADVDIIVVTKLDPKEYTPDEALNLFVPFLDKYYKDKYRIQGRSIGISLSYVDLDIVPTAAPSESQKGLLKSDKVSSDYAIEEFQNYDFYKSENRQKSLLLESLFNFYSSSGAKEQWRNEPLLIPDRDAQTWEKTHPLEQIRWTVEKNKICNNHYINVVKALKWWRKEKYPDVKQPKSYPLEHFIGDCCPDEINGVAEGVVLALEKIVCDYSDKPFLSDRGVSEHDVFARITEKEYSDFYDTVCEAANLARSAYDSENLKESVDKWRELFGNKFPSAPDNKSNESSGSGFTVRTERTDNIKGGRFA